LPVVYSSPPVDLSYPEEELTCDDLPWIQESLHWLWSSLKGASGGSAGPGEDLDV